MRLIGWSTWIIFILQRQLYAELCHNETNSDCTLSAEKRLTKHLLGNYMWAGRDGRPVRDISRATLVDMMLGLINIELDESDKVLTTSMWAKMQWYDEYLTWDPSQYEGLEVARIESFNVWTPDIMLYNTAEPESKVRNSLIMAHPDGKLVWVLHQIFKSSCSVNVTDFPFDTQVCHMWFGSWTHKNHEIDMNFLHQVGIDLGTFQADYKDSCEWDIIQTNVERITPSNISVLTYEIHMQRKMVFSSYILTLPCVFLATLTLVVFCLPPERPDRTGLAMNIFSSFLVLLLILVEAAPSSASSVPKLGIYYCFNMVIIMMSIFLSSLVVNLHRTDTSTQRMPRWLRIIFLKILTRVTFLHKPIAVEKKRKSNFKNELSCNGHANENIKLLQNGFCDNKTHKRITSQSANEDNNSINDEIGHGTKSNYTEVFNHCEKHCDVSIMADIRHKLGTLENFANRKSREEERRRCIIYEWRLLAKVLDRIFFVLYLMAIILSLMFLFPKPQAKHLS